MAYVNTEIKKIILVCMIVLLEKKDATYLL